MTEVLQSMMKLYSGVHGRMTDLVKAHQAKYNTAIAVALGRFFDAIVVENKNVAFQCIKVQSCDAMFVTWTKLMFASTVHEATTKRAGNVHPDQ